MSSKLKNSITFKWSDSNIELLPLRAAFIKETKELLISDIHLGKGEYFQSNGIPLTNLQDHSNFCRIFELVKKIKPAKLFILGDLFHSKFAITKELLFDVEKLSELLNITIELIEGNHDIGCHVSNIDRSKTKTTSTFIYSHQEIKNKGPNQLNICGHYHPKVYIKNFKSNLGFRCFAFDNVNNILYLPAFGDLTGGQLCKRDLKKWAIISDKFIYPI